MDNFFYFVLRIADFNRCIVTQILYSINKWNFVKINHMNINSVLRAFPSRELKFLAYTISKHYFLAFNISLYNTSNIKDSIFLSLHLNIVFLFSVSFSLSSFSLFLFETLPFSENPPLSLQTQTHS